MAFKSQKYELVELVVPGVTAPGQTQTRWNFPDLPKLRYTALQAISFFTPGTITASPLNNALLPLAVLQKSYLVLYANDRTDLYRIPVLELNRMQALAGGITEPFARGLFEFNNQKVTWEKSYIEIASAPANTVNESFLLGIYYS
jgi:hypothetical protein